MNEIKSLYYKNYVLYNLNRKKFMCILNAIYIKFSIA